MHEMRKSRVFRFKYRLQIVKLLELFFRILKNSRMHGRDAEKTRRKSSLGIWRETTTRVSAAVLNRVAGSLPVLILIFYVSDSTAFSPRQLFKSTISNLSERRKKDRNSSPTILEYPSTASNIFHSQKKIAQ